MGCWEGKKIRENEREEIKITKSVCIAPELLFLFLALSLAIFLFFVPPNAKDYTLLSMDHVLALILAWKLGNLVGGNDPYGTFIFDTVKIVGLNNNDFLSLSAFDLFNGFMTTEKLVINSQSVNVYKSEWIWRILQRDIQ